jgi:hypothetical protein
MLWGENEKNEMNNIINTMISIRPKRFHPILAVALATILFTSCVQAATKWQYKILVLPYNAPPMQADPILSELGADGWELVSVSGTIFYFKRPL